MRNLSNAIALCVVLALLSALGRLAGVLVVLGPLVVPGWTASAGLLVLVLALGLAAYGRFRRTATPPRRLLPRWLVAVLAVLSALATLLGAVADLGADYRVLEPAGPRGCRAVVREHAVLFSGGGDVHPVGWWGIGLRGSSWTADDGYRVIASGTYELKWSGDSGVLVVRGRSGDPVWPALHDVDC
ncbi:hypothetical protein JOF53_007777 [Crossiella equi]|uniref:Uncharacterized protein n=1 Tax=Crossiella equi TaxID=130796 RepID=A0ABS5AQR1_9PSEU|nr:hypothetical protein [Crossiella equi]MBP2478905.1 hypothetical protein [Crossiella equi]